MDLGGSELVPSRRGARPGVVRRYLLLRAAADGNAGCCNRAGNGERGAFVGQKFALCWWRGAPFCVTCRFCFGNTIKEVGETLCFSSGQDRCRRCSRLGDVFQALQMKCCLPEPWFLSAVW